MAAYIVKALDSAKGIIREGVEVKWVADDIRVIEPEFIRYYEENPAVFSILAGPDISSISHGAHAAAYIDFNLVAEAGMTITINGVDYVEADTAVPATGVWTNGASPANSAASLLAALNGDLRADVPFTASPSVGGDGVWLFWDDVGTDGNISISTDSAGACTVQDSTGGLEIAETKTAHVVHTVNTQELLSGGIEIPLPFTPTGFHVTAVTSAGIPVYFTDTVAIGATPDRIIITTAGVTNLANTDVVTVTAFN